MTWEQAHPGGAAPGRSRGADPGLCASREMEPWQQDWHEDPGDGGSTASGVSSYDDSPFGTEDSGTSSGDEVGSSGGWASGSEAASTWSSTASNSGDWADDPLDTEAVSLPPGFEMTLSDGAERQAAAVAAAGRAGAAPLVVSRLLDRPE